MRMKFLILFLLWLSSCANEKTVNVADASITDSVKPSNEIEQAVPGSEPVQLSNSSVPGLTAVEKPGQKKALEKAAAPDFRILEATSEQWQSGLRGGGHGTEYYFRIRIETTSPIKFDSAWINGVAHALFYSREDATVSLHPVRFSKGDSITLRVSQIIKPQQPIKETKSAAPRSYKGAALIGYRIHNTTKYISVPAITKIKGPNRS